MATIANDMTPEMRDLFERSFLPEIEARSRLHYARLNPEAREESVQESCSIAWQMFRSAVNNGRTVDATPGSLPSKRGRVTPASLALFANRRCDSGWRFVRSSSTDLLGDRTRILGRVRLTSLDGDEGEVLGEALADRRAEADPAGLAAAKVDWSTFRRSGLLTDKAKTALDLVAQGYRNGQLARRLGVCDSRSTQIRQQIGAAVIEFFGREAIPAVRRVSSKRKGAREKGRRRSSRQTRGAASKKGGTRRATPRRLSPPA